MDTIPESVSCPECGRQIAEYESYRFVLDTWPRCNIIESAGGGYFVSESFLTELRRAKATGYSHHKHPVRIEMSNDFRRSYANADELFEKLPLYYYFMVTGRCDGPWIENIQKESCTTCRQPRAVIRDFNASMAQILGKAPVQPRLVFPQTWHGEDFFLVSEPGAPIITQKVVNILDKTGNLRVEVVSSDEQVYIRRAMPQYAEILALKNWQRGVCPELGPAAWTKP